MAVDDPPPMSYILGLNQLVDEQFAYESSETNEFLAGLNSLPSGNGESATPEDTANISNQLALWTNANFSFDGPTGHALLGDEDKDNDPAAPDHHDEVQSRLQRYAAATNIHSVAARDKDRESHEPEIPCPTQSLPALQGMQTSSTQWSSSGTHRQPACPSLPGLPNVQPWDLTSTLALEYLLSRNNGNDSGRAETPQARPPPPPAPPMQSNTSSENGSLFCHLVQAAMAQPSGDTNTPLPEETRASSSSEHKADVETEFTVASSSRRMTVSDRVKLIDTGNPEADAEANRAAIEEDKRRRNTAASARFRIKKKQREAALELAARELETRVNELKQDNERLRTENEWLKRLISGRNENISLPLTAAYIPPDLEVLQARHMFGHSENR